MSSLPIYHATLAPEFGPAPNNAAVAINITLRITDTRLKSGSPLLTLSLNRGTTPTLQYDGDALAASDDSGPLPLTYEDTSERNADRTWSATRDPAGQVTVRVKAVPRKTVTPGGPRIDLRYDRGGIIGFGYGFLPHPPANEDWEVHVDWDIPDSAPSGTRTASSLGDGLKSQSVAVPTKVIPRCAFAVGPLHRYPSWDTAKPDGKRQEFGMYWLQDLPYNIGRIGPLTENLFRSIAGFFGDSTNPFRVFIRQVAAGHGGAGGHHSFLLECNPGIEHEQTEENLINLLAHETVHEYPLMQPMSMDDAWYNEGVANYYATIAAFEGGAVDRKYLVRALNNNAQAYYTTDVINLTWEYIKDHYWDNFQITKAGYGRGCMYLAKLQGLIHQATGGKKGIDNVVLELYQRQLKRVDCHSDDLHELVAQIIGKEETEKSRAGMEGGELIVPPEDCFAKYGLKMVRRDVEKFEAGFDPGSLRANANMIKGLVAGSRAAEAGLREGDEVVRSWMLWGAGDALENMMEVTVRRDGKEQTFKYWPRSYAKVENWVWVEADEASIVS
jgi:hypothetical protein